MIHYNMVYRSLVHFTSYHTQATLEKHRDNELSISTHDRVWELKFDSMAERDEWNCTFEEWIKNTDTGNDNNNIIIDYDIGYPHTRIHYFQPFNLNKRGRFLYRH